MAQKLCQLKKKGGGKLKETVLWTNPSPTSSLARSTVTLSDSVNNYDYIGIYSSFSTTTTNTKTLLTIIPSTDFITTVGVNQFRAANSVTVGDYQYMRSFRCDSTTQVLITDNIRIFDAEGTKSNANNIVTKIVGLKY